MSILQAILAMTAAGGGTPAPRTNGIRIMEMDATGFTSGTWPDLASPDYFVTSGNVAYTTDKFTFNGGYMYNSGNPGAVNLLHPTAAIWVYFNTLPGQADGTLIGGQQWALRVDSSNLLNMVKYNVIDQRVTIPQLQTGQWYHIVAAIDTTETRYYINGVKVGTYTDSQSVLSSNGALSIISNSNLNVDVAKAQLYNFALSDIAVAGLYNSECAQFGLSPVTPPAVVTTSLWGIYDPLTYSGSGNLLEGQGNSSRNFTVSNGSGSISYSTRNRGKFICTGANQDDRIYLPNNFTGGTWTFMYAGRLTGGQNHRVLQGINNNWLLGPWYGNTNSFFSEGWVYPETVGPSDGLDTNWKIHTGTVDTGADSYKYYNNGTRLALNTSGSWGPDGLAIFGSGTGYMYPAEHSAAEVGVVLIWNKVLNDTEVQEAYDYYRTRYGI